MLGDSWFPRRRLFRNLHRMEGCEWGLPACLWEAVWLHEFLEFCVQLILLHELQVLGRRGIITLLPVRDLRFLLRRSILNALWNSPTFGCAAV